MPKKKYLGHYGKNPIFVFESSHICYIHLEKGQKERKLQRDIHQTVSGGLRVGVEVRLREFSFVTYTTLNVL